MRAAHTASRPASAPGTLHGLGFAVWAFAVALGVCIHEWQKAQQPLTLTGIEVVLALGVLLRPSSVLRIMALLASVAVELLNDLPNVFNHTFIIGTVSIVLLTWWLLRVRRAGSEAREPAYIYRSIAPFLRAAFVMILFAAAFAKLNTGFLDPVTTCAVWILDAIPRVSIPTGFAGLMIVGAIITEFAIPALLVFRRTRFLGVILGIGFGVITALAGHAPFAGFGWSFYVLFIPPWTLGRVVVTVRRRIGPRLRERLVGASSSPVAWVILGAAGLLVMAAVRLAPDDIVALIKRYGATAAFCAWMLIWTVLLLRNWRHWIRTPQAGSRTFGAGHAVFAVAIVLIVLNAASPYLGLKTTFSFTMFSNVQTEPGRWNHVVVPEAFRIFNLQQGIVRFDEISDPRLAAEVYAYSGPGRWSSGAVPYPNASMVLLAAQRLASRYPDATIRYEYNGKSYLAAPVSSDPILGVPVSLLVQKLGGFRPLDIEDTCQL